MDKYPLIYREYDEGLAKMLRETAQPYSPPYCNLRYGFEFREGWCDLVDEFSETVTSLVLHLRAGIQKDAYVHSYIFKEKFGMLRLSWSDNLIAPFRELYRGYARDIANRSEWICEVTGKLGKLRRIGGRLQTLCDDEYAKLSQDVS
jgi:hypothetical protein